MAAAKKIAAREADDKDVIRACITVAECLAAKEAGIRADPSGNFDNVEAMGRRFYERAMKALTVATEPAMTKDGVHAKARLVPVVLDEFRHFAFPQNAADFVRSAALDAKRYFDPAYDGEVDDE